MTSEPTPTPESDRPSRRGSPHADGGQRRVAAVAFLTVLVAGGLGGIALDWWLLRPSDPLLVDSPLFQPRDAWESELVRELRLTPAQRQELDSLLTDAEARVRAVSREAGPRFRSILRETFMGLRAILTPEQRQRLQEIRRERQTGWQERLEELRQRGFNVPDSAATTERGTPRR